MYMLVMFVVAGMSLPKIEGRVKFDDLFQPGIDRDEIEASLPKSAGSFRNEFVTLMD